MREVNFLFFANIILSLALFVFGLYTVLFEGDYPQGLQLMGLGFIIGINDWIKLLKKKK
jgi:drug/metabolite transporter (DMT)-like permease